jgi:hypothetical protein
MPIQDTGANAKQYMRVKDGCKVSVKATGEVAYTSFGALKGNTDLKLNWTEVQAQTANAGKTDLYAKQATVEGQITLYNLDIANVMRTTSGLFTPVVTPGTAHTSIVDQVIPVGWADKTRYELKMIASSTDSSKLKMATAPTITSVTLDAGGSPEVLAAWGTAASTDYTIVADSNSSSGWSIVFNSAGLSTGSPTTKAITIVYGSNTPVARTTYNVGSSIVALASFAIKFEYTNSAGKVSGREIYKCYAKPGAITLGYGGADEDGFEEMQIQFNGVLDTTLADGAQLMSAYEDQ